MNPELMTIGELSQRSGVPVKTIRFYSDSGVLPPVHVTASRYRLYDDDSELRLELIRTLRRLDFGLETIRGLFDENESAEESLRLQLTALDAEVRRLRRARAVVSHALESDGGATMDALKRFQAVALLDRCEREAFLAESLGRHLADVPVAERWQSWLFETAFSDLPEELDDGQWRALLELAELVSDEDFGRSLAESSRSFWSTAGARYDHDAWQAAMGELVGGAMAAQRAEEPLDGDVARELVDRLVRTFAEVQGREPDADFEKEMSERIGSHDPRAERFWELVSVLKGGQGPSPTSRAFRWLFAALAARHAAPDTD